MFLTTLGTLSLHWARKLAWFLLLKCLALDFCFNLFGFGSCAPDLLGLVAIQLPNCLHRPHLGSLTCSWQLTLWGRMCWGIHPIRHTTEAQITALRFLWHWDPEFLSSRVKFWICSDDSPEFFHFDAWFVLRFVKIVSVLVLTERVTTTINLKDDDLQRQTCSQDNQDTEFGYV